MAELAPSFESYTTPIGSLTAGAAITQYRCVTINASNNVQHTAANGRVDGIALVGTASGEAVPIIHNGIVTVEAGGTFADGATLVPTTAGKVIASTNGLGALVALEGATDGAQVRAYLKERIQAGAGIEIITNTPGAISLAVKTSIVLPTGTDAMTLASGLYDGQEKTIRQGTGASTPIMTVTGVFNTDGVATTVATFNAAAEQLDLVWSTTLAAWLVMANTGSVGLA